LRFFAEGGAFVFRKIRVRPLVKKYKPYPGGGEPTNVGLIRGEPGQFPSAEQSLGRENYDGPLATFAADDDRDDPAF
jgi:hypothetical protein